VLSFGHRDKLCQPDELKTGAALIFEQRSVRTMTGFRCLEWIRDDTLAGFEAEVINSGALTLWTWGNWQIVDMTG
jgi:hypothetical protein